MEKVKVICNPSSGRQIIQRRIDYLCNLLINDGYIVGNLIQCRKMMQCMKPLKLVKRIGILCSMWW